MKSNTLQSICLTVLCTLATTLYSQETDVDSAILSMKTCGPIGAGSITPASAWGVYKISETVDISATANDGFLFSSWSIQGLGTITDASSATTTVTLLGNATVFANFIQSGNLLTGDLNVTVTPALAGNVTPAATTTLDLGETQEIAATPTGTYKFLKWEAEGAVNIDNIYAATTNIVLKGPATVNAIFAETADTFSLTLEANALGDGGSIKNTGTQSIAKGGTVSIQAIPESGYIFTGWHVSGLSEISSQYSPEATITLYEDTTVSATFKEFTCTYSHVRRRIIIKKRDGGTGYMQNRDYIKTRWLPMCLDSKTFNPNTDTIEVIVDGNTFTINKDEGRFTRNAHGYRYISFRKSNGGPTVRLTLNFTHGTWDFYARGINLEAMDNSDGIDIIMYVNGGYYGRKYDMDEKTYWKFDIKRNTEQAIDSPETDMDSFTISKIKGMSRNDKDNRDSLRIPKASIQLPLGSTFDPALQVVTLNVGEESIIIPAGSFETIKANKFLYKNTEKGIRMLLDLKKNRWSLIYSKFSGWNNINPETGLKVYLKVGGVQSGLNIVPSFTRKLRYNYNRFYWRR